jgi:[ribosomal protein S18]-alanine N-acetyltransferase
VASGFAIEYMRERDVPEVVEIEKVCFTTPWPASAYKRELKSSDTTRYIIARHYAADPLPPAPPPKKNSFMSRLLPFLHHENEPELPNPHPIAGYGGLWMMLDEAHITTIGVAPAYRGRGIGELLLIAMIDQAMEGGASWLTLEVRVSNTVAQNLYHKYTFREAGVRKRYYTDNDEDAYIMWSEEITKLSFRTKYKELKAALLQKLADQGELAAPLGYPLPTDPAKPIILGEFQPRPELVPPPFEG